MAEFRAEISLPVSARATRYSTFSCDGSADGDARLSLAPPLLHRFNATAVGDRRAHLAPFSFAPPFRHLRPFLDETIFPPTTLATPIGSASSNSCCPAKTSCKTWSSFWRFPGNIRRLVLSPVAGPATSSAKPIVQRHCEMQADGDPELAEMAQEEVDGAGAEWGSWRPNCSACCCPKIRTTPAIPLSKCARYRGR